MSRTQLAGASGPPVGGATRDEILRFLDDTFDRANWAHKGLLSAIRGLGIEEAVWKPFPAIHSVSEQLNHIAHWKRYVLQRVRGLRPRSYQAWPPVARTAADLRRARSGLEGLHRDLHRAVVRLGSRELAEKKGGRYPLAQLLLASAAHESYHVGQILLTRKLYRQARRAHGAAAPVVTRAGGIGWSAPRRPSADGR